MTKHTAADDRTLQDDRAELAADPHEPSPLVEGEGAPLAEDDVPHTEPPVVTHALLGGAAVPVIAEEPRSSPASAITAAEDRPIGD